MTPDDVQYLAPFVFGHRMILRPEAKYEGISTEEIIERILTKVRVPVDKVALNEKSSKFVSCSGRFIFVLFVLASAFVFAMFQGGKVSWTIFYILLPFILYSIALFFYPLSGLNSGTNYSYTGCAKWRETYCVNYCETKISFSITLYGCD